MMEASQDGHNSYFADDPDRKQVSKTEQQSGKSSNNDFSPHFLVAAAAASAQAEAARAASTLPPLLSSTAASSSSSSSLPAISIADISPQPPLPYMEGSTPFPLRLGDRVVNSSQDNINGLNGKSRATTDVSDRVRCCWAILSTRSDRLEFLYIDPSFSRHLSSQSSSILGSSFFDYIHPEEEERTRMDMKNIIGSRTLFGSVTRCRYSSLPRIRSLLIKSDEGKKGNSSSTPASDYLAIDIVVNWIGEDMALCFFHAIIDESAQDNDEINKTEWSNWCGMKPGSFSQGECESIWKAIQSHRSLTSSTTGPQYVFQLLSAVPSQQTSASPPNILFSWPPPRLFASPTQDALTASAINFADGSYFIDDFARLAQGVDQLTLKKELSDANTSCTRRFRAKHTLTTEGMVRSVESVLIPYGSIVLACFSVTYAQMLPGTAAAMASEMTSAAASNKAASTSKNGQSREMTGKNTNGSISLPSLFNNKRLSTNAPQEGDAKAHLPSSDNGGSVATLAAVAAAAASQSKICGSCGTSNSPEWRKGPDGTKSLCNACGLRYSRNISRAKKREERAKIAAEVAANGGIIPPHLLKKHGDDKKMKRKKMKVSPSEGDATLPTDGTADADTDTSNSGDVSTEQDSLKVARAAAQAAAVAGLHPT